MSKNEECQELKNIKYKSMLQNSKNNILLKTITEDISNCHLLINNKELTENMSWNKLDKSNKMKKIDEYIEKISSNYKLTKTEIDNLKLYLSNIIDKKFLSRNRDVTYIKETGCLEDIPNLTFNNTTRKFNFKKSGQSTTTSKSLGPTKKKRQKSEKKK